MDTPVLASVEHSLTQAALIAYLWPRRERWDVLVLPNMTLAEGRLPSPDIGVAKAGASLDQAPFLCIEIVSPGDDAKTLERRIDAYLESGASFVWVLDPEAQVASIHSAEASVLVPDGWLRAEEIEVPLDEIFA
ncbi:MAG: Uma2 family endonuclease [Bryobacteraceae bacterium]|nr:Uma2 family endonuclease [Bryobacteraceae bacterium]